MLSLPGRTLVICGQGAPEETEQELRQAGAEILRLPQLGGRLELPAVMQALGRLGMNEVLIESGATLAGQALLAGLVDELIVYVAPQLMGHEGRALVELPGLYEIQDRLQLALADVRSVGRDIRLTLRPAPGPQAA
jgi:diaminohydroxyphosphoribosylaminopyrimidine deaminase/5-amino-6-(5-phosphoribosylamino)uracil reductase